MRSSRWYANGFARSRNVHLVSLLFGCIATGFICGVHRQPIYGDSGWFLYASQAVHRGEPLYSGVGYGYTPYGALVGAVSIAVGRVFALPTYLAPRYLNLLAHALCPCTLYLVSMRVMPRAQLRAFLAGATFAGFGMLTVVSVNRLNPKTWLTLCSVLCVLCILRGQWTLAGLFASIAAMFWQLGCACAVAAGVVALSVDVAGRRRAVTGLTTGIVLGAVPCVVYLTAAGEWEPFWLSAVCGQFAADSAAGAAGILRWLTMPAHFWTEAPVFVIAFLAFIVYHVSAIREAGCAGFARRNPAFVVTVFTAAHVAVLMMDFDGIDDAGPLLPYISWWAAVYAPRGLAKLSGALRRGFPSRPPWGDVAGLIPPALALVLLFGDTPMYAPRFSLDDQRAFLRRVTQDGEIDFLAINAPEFYTLAEKPSPIPHIVFYPRIDWLAQAGGIESFVVAVADELQPVVIVQEQRFARSTLQRLLARHVTGRWSAVEYHRLSANAGLREVYTGVTRLRKYAVYHLTPADISRERNAIHHGLPEYQPGAAICAGRLLDRGRSPWTESGSGAAL